ncbi:ribose ABC transporter substrate-binding protein RbsB [Cytobacillus horneckiae]|uniref:Ribose ABC transporter substrate-binding protein RbsB n=1 Tax=Cytobacillus horneckiae TaxID=549687 RepID=A0A2N0ZL70_9BACI|nr:ribose ABC transporter substrate-binding protein RbsB [Cytobacillus horneckiae]MEC1156197.1 ribose ABC transporter substrate-binding protein RbsB [Cytobacillus horneckiae]MED2938215.1 ribose ABC transporter substrate-binding protein RbsB [Cytobacillus horneckiae]PKG30260.1 ribose ABC transporter substrate-binding protein RbsB [Cytobacillus horneckiae]
MKHIWKLFVMVMILFIVSACSLEGGDTKGTEEKGAKDDTAAKKIGISISTLNNPYFVTLKDSAEAKAKELGMETTTVDAQNDPAKQVSDIEDLIQQGVDILLINPADSSAIAAAINSANNANIPVITVDRSAEGGEVVAHVASDNAAGGKMAGEYIIEQLGEEAKVVELEGIPGSSAARERGAGFNEAIAAASGYEVASKQAANFDRAQGLTVMENIIQSTKDFKAVFAHNDEMALGAVQALNAAGLTDVIVVGFDATEDAVKAVEDGKMAATVAQKPDLMGEQAIEAAQKVLKDETVEEFIPVELELIK